MIVILILAVLFILIVIGAKSEITHDKNTEKKLDELLKQKEEDEGEKRYTLKELMEREDKI